MIKSKQANRWLQCSVLNAAVTKDWVDERLGAAAFASVLRGCCPPRISSLPILDFQSRLSHTCIVARPERSISTPMCMLILHTALFGWLALKSKVEQTEQLGFFFSYQQFSHMLSNRSSAIITI